MSVDVHLLDPSTHEPAQVFGNALRMRGRVEDIDDRNWNSRYARDAAGAHNAIGDYSGGEHEFFVSPPATHIAVVHRVIVTIRDGAAFRAEGYGAIPGGLANGISIRVMQGATVLNDLMDGVPVQTNAEWQRTCYDFALSNFGAGDNYGFVRWTFARAGTPIRLDGTKGQRLGVFLHDDLTDLIAHNFIFQGYAVAATDLP